MRDPLLDDGPLALYRQSPIRKDWKHPSQEDVADSLQKAHEVNKKLIATVNELLDSKKKMKKDMDELDTKLGESKTRAMILTSLLSSCVTTTLLAGLVALARYVAH